MSARNRVSDLLRQVEGGLPPCRDAGDFYDNARRRQDAVSALIKAEQDQEVVKLLQVELERARDVGD